MALQVGAVVGNYRLVQLIGEGGFGEVYLAENPLIGRRAAVKILHPELARNEELVHRFLNEARAASAIRHPSIVQVFDAGVDSAGAPYLLMEFLEGQSLQKRLAEVGRLAMPEVLAIANQAGAALAAAHEAGIVHRDLKPENLFLVPDKREPTGELVKILDFGIAKMVGGGGPAGMMRTHTGTIMGSPAYMSPEQCKDSADVDRRTDIYSFATILYELVAGRTPHVAPSGTELLIMHLTATPPPLHALTEHVPDDVEAAIMRGLAREREQRFDSMDDFLLALHGGAPASVAVQPMPVAGISAEASRPVLAQAQTPLSPSSTTFSRSTGEIDDASLLAAVRPRRWLSFALAGTAVLGLAIFLMVRPRPDARTPAKAGSTRAASAVPRVPENTRPPALVVSVPLAPAPAPAGKLDAGVTVSTAGERPRAAKRAHGRRHQQTESQPTISKGRPVEEWLAH